MHSRVFLGNLRGRPRVFIYMGLPLRPIPGFGNRNKRLKACGCVALISERLRREVSQPMIVIGDMLKQLGGLLGGEILSLCAGVGKI